MDFAIETDGLIGRMTFHKAENILNNVFLSLAVPRGGWWFNPQFGSRLHLLRREKNTERTAILAREYCKEALQWLITARRAQKIEVATERDIWTDPHRLKAHIEVTQADGRQVTFETFVEVV